LTKVQSFFVWDIGCWSTDIELNAMKRFFFDTDAEKNKLGRLPK